MECARYGFKAVVKHVPDQAFALDEQHYRRLGRRFESALALWGAADDIHMVMIATFSVAMRISEERDRPFRHRDRRIRERDRSFR